MNHLELREARESLGLTPEDAARLLDLETPKSIYRMELDPRHATSIKPPRRVVRLYRAYLDGHRPEDWPKQEERTA